MAETEPIGEVEAAAATNGSGQLEDKVQDLIPEKKGEEESSAKVLENVEGSPDKKKPQELTKAVAEDAKLAEHESSKTTEAVESKIAEVEDAKMIEPEDPRIAVANAEDLKIIEAEEATMVVQTAEAEANVARKTAEAEAVKMTEPVDANATKAAVDDPKIIEADDEDAKTIETANANMTQIVDGKDSKAEAEVAKVTGFEAEDVKMAEPLNVKTTEAVNAMPTEADAVDAKPIIAEMAEAVNSNATVSNVDDVKKPEAKEEKTFEAAHTAATEAEDAKMTEAEDTKIITAEEANTSDAKDHKAVQAEETKAKVADDVKTSEGGDAEVVRTEDENTVEGEDGNTAVDKDVKILASEELKASKPEDIAELEDENAGNVKMAEAEDLKDAKGNKEKLEEGEAEIQNEDSAKGKMDDSPDKKADDNVKAKGLKRKRSSKPKVSGESEEKNVGSKPKAEEGFSTPVSSSADRPVRERKTVERLVEVIEKEASREFLIEKGRGTALKDIPNVAHKLSRKKPADLKFLHQALFGRRGKAVDFKNHLLQFSGFVWHENEEKQRAKIKDKLDKCVKDALVELCDLFDIPAAKVTSRKEDLVVKLLDFMAAPYATTDVILAEKYQLSPRSGKRKRVSQGSASRSAEVTPAKWVRKKRTKSENTAKLRGKFAPEINEEDQGDEGQDSENGLPNENEAQQQSESEGKKGDSEEPSEDEDDEDWGKEKTDLKKIPTSGSEKSKLQASHKKTPVTAATKSPGKMSPSKHMKFDDTNNLSARVFSRKKRNSVAPKKLTSSKSATKEKSSGKRVSKAEGRTEEEKESGPSNEELRETICGILKEVDFSMATFTDIVKRLAAHYNMDLSARKNTIKTMVQEELTKLADEAEEDEDGDERDAEDEHPKPKAKEIEA